MPISQEQFELLKEHGENVANNAANRAANKIQEILGCYDGCLRENVNWWMGFALIGKTKYPLTYIAIGAAAFVGLILGVVNLL